MTASRTASPASPERLSKIWFTRCPVPTATGLAYKLGWLDQEFARDGIAVSTLQDGPQELRRHHGDHELATLFREGGNIPALIARARRAPSRLVGLTWIDEWQTILVRPGSGISEPAHLKGRRVALPSWGEDPRRRGSIARGMTLHGIKGALAYAGLGFDDVRFVEVGGALWDGLENLARDEVDAVYVKGASAVDSARRHGAVVGIDLDALPERRFRVNNGTPRPITVHQSLIDDHFDIVVRFLAQALRAADWSRDNAADVHRVLEGETRGSAEAVATAYRNGFHQSLHPDLSDERLGFLKVQKDFLLLHGFLDADFDIDAWVDRRPLEAALKLNRSFGASVKRAGEAVAA